MSLTKKQHQESTESYAAQGMHNSPMGVPPQMDQLHDRQNDTQLTSKRAEVDLIDDSEETQDSVAETEEEAPDVSRNKEANLGLGHS